MVPSVNESVFPAELGSIPDITEYVSSSAGQAGLHLKQITRLQVGIDEVMSNICQYAYLEPPGEVFVRIEVTEASFTLSFIDRGIPFDPLAVDSPDVALGLAERDPGGLGIFLLRGLIDEIHYKRDGDQNVLSLVLRVP